jgi:hypothetical protein
LGVFGHEDLSRQERASVKTLARFPIVKKNTPRKNTGAAFEGASSRGAGGNIGNRGAGEDTDEPFSRRFESTTNAPDSPELKLHS